MALPSSVRNVKITDNTINIGYSSSTSSVTTHTYSGCMLIAADSMITGNTIAGCIGGSSGSTDLVSVTSGSCTFTGNYFIRGAGSPVGTYINVTSSTDQFIHDNVFDQPTVNGTSDVLVTGLSAASLYMNNKNQSALVEVTLSDNMMMYSASGNSPTWTGAYGSVNSVFWSEFPNISSTSTPGSDFITIEDSAGALTRSWIKRFNLSGLVPKGAKIVGAQAGTGCIGASGIVNSSSFFAIRLTSYKKIAMQGTSGTILDVIDNRSNVSNYIQQDAYNSTTMDVLTFATTYVSLDTTNYSASDVSENYRIGGDYNTVLEWKFLYNKTDSSTAGFVFSPVVVKYRW